MKSSFETPGYDVYIINPEQENPFDSAMHRISYKTKIKEPSAQERVKAILSVLQEEKIDEIPEIDLAIEGKELVRNKENCIQTSFDINGPVE